MSIINSQPLIGASGNQSTAYNLTRSLRFRSSASAYLNRSMSAGTSTQKGTQSFWIKRGTLAVNQNAGLCAEATTYPVNGAFNAVLFSSGDILQILCWNGSSYDIDLETTQVFRDPSAWYHIVIAWDTTQATASNRVKLYVNGSQVTSFGVATYPSQNTNLTGWGASNNYTIGTDKNNSNVFVRFFDGYYAEFIYVDGQALDASSFGETDTATGVWKPKKYTGTYGTNGFYLKFDNLTSTSTLGNDSSGNSNTWTVNNISLTSGSTYDSMKDVPTLTDADTANYAVLNPLSKGSDVSITNGNLTYSLTGSTNCNMYSSIGMTSGKFYCEVTIAANQYSLLGISDANVPAGNGFYQQSRGYGYYGSNGNKYNTGSASAYGATFTAGDVIGIAFDADAGTLTFYKNNTSQGTAFTGIPAGTYYFCEGNVSNLPQGSFNFGQQPFTYTPPTGYVALNTYNLPTPTIGATASTQANKYFDVKLYTGDGTSPKQVVTGVGFQPDFAWTKTRSIATEHALYDAVRGAGSGKILLSNTTNAEGGSGGTSDATYGYLSAFNSDGFTTTKGSDATNYFFNNNTQTYVSWLWKANGAGSSNTAGSITSTVSANTTAGFSIVKYVGAGTTSTVGHGLGVAPAFIILKDTSSGAYNWICYHQSIGATGYVHLNLTAATQTSSSGGWNDTAPTSTVFTLGSGNANANTNGNNNIAYCFAEVAGYSKFGSYTGNGSTDGPFLYMGFRPKFYMYKRTDSTSNWVIMDSTRNPYNAAGLWLYPNLSNAENDVTSTDQWDFLSNGLKVRSNGSATNANGGTYIYAAFAENPFKYSLGR